MLPVSNNGSCTVSPAPEPEHKVEGTPMGHYKSNVRDQVFNLFEAVYVMTEGRPGGSTNTVLYYIYTEAFQSYRMGYASAIAWVLFVILFAATLVQFMVRRRNERVG